MDYRDKSIHNLLRSITESYKKASTSNSRYYKKESICIRFSDHYSEHKEANFEIIKLSNGCYSFTDKDLHITSCFYKEDILRFLKNYFSMRDFFADTIKDLQKSLKKSSRNLQQMYTELNSAKLRSDLEVADSIYEENKKLKEELKCAKSVFKENKKLKQKIVEQKIKLNDIKNKLISINNTLQKSVNTIESM